MGICGRCSGGGEVGIAFGDASGGIHGTSRGSAAFLDTPFVNEDNDTTVVLVHGWAQSSRVWGQRVLDGLGERYRVVVMDLRGHGVSEKPDEKRYRAQDFADDLHAVIDSANINGPLVLLGWSYGGLVLCDYLQAHGADRIDAAVLVGAITGIGSGAWGGQIGPAMRAALPDALSPEMSTALPALTAFARAMVPGDADDELAELVLGQALSTPSSTRRGLFDRSASYDALLADLQLPMLVMHGADDPVVSIDSARHNEELIANVTAKYWNSGGHMPFREDPDAFCVQVREFIESVVPEVDS